MWIIFFIIINTGFEISGKNFTRCELYRELQKQGFQPELLRDWLCLVEAESSGHTDAIGGPDEDGSFDYGLFQINSRYWCSSSAKPGKGCHVRCKDLLSDDITTASACTKIIYSRQGLSAWVAWENECKNKDLPDVTDCTDTLYTD